MTEQKTIEAAARAIFNSMHKSELDSVSNPAYYDEAKAALSTLTPGSRLPGGLVVEQDWQPIETAPKDGTWVWAFIPAKHIPKAGNFTLHLGVRHRAVHWVSEIKQMKGKPAPQDALEFINIHGGFWSCDRQGRKALGGAPSHWKPLSEAPMLSALEGK